LKAKYPDLEGRVVFVTGGATGIGAAFVESFAAQGARASFIDFNSQAGEELSRRTGSWFRHCDVTDVSALQQAVSDAAADLGALDVLINNVANDQRHAAEELDERAWRASLAVNLDPVIHASNAAYRIMRPVRRGVIINVSSINALLAPAGMAAYVAAKAAILGLTRSLSREWGPANIRVNAISPGWVATERQLKLWLTPEAEADWMQQVSLQRRMLPEDVAKLAVFLASDEASLITGQNYVIDGGRT
jgi:NAD(P)-dependent dehydrogenase (short-subunit alcohol dehydrogenase family)